MVDATTGHEALSFMDGSSGYNQIRMTLSDEEMAVFRTPKGIYCYKVMPFGLKNDGASYHRAMQKVFDDMLHKLRMNPLKYAFDVTSRKFLGFIVRHREIEIDQSKIDVIQKMPRPKRKVSRRIVGARGQEGKGTCSLLSKYNLSWVKVNYSPIEKMCLALFFAIDKLRHYMQAFTVHLVAKVDPIKHRPHSPEKYMLPYSFAFVELCSNNVAEYQALIIGLQMALEIGVSLTLRRIVYYWPKMVQDSMYAKKCEACQYHANFIHQPLEPLLPTVASWSFEAWRLDLVGPITPKSSAEHSYILAATDYFSKWVEAISLREVKKENVANFIRIHIIYRYAVNDLAEAFNKTLCNLLKKIVSKSKRDWQERIGEALWAYRTTHRTPTGVTPYSLVYSVEVILPLEREISSLRMAVQEELTTEDNVKLRLQELEALDEKRLEAQQALECYQARMSKAFDKHVKAFDKHV
ncbi:uncharacterized protein E5676_scaffold1706G00190 [Cucumis melo var. makuwa]|uniref:Reverse transcriptase domain-containing protein n=1 Tax=Cucumis melo var. makuwa TaxID=1194695 RepID=A0A5D3CTX3_CUCMM|nr:uncharacterized protein E5676_scaffold1706G00190 [Cucumis melo var. makuwa]